LVFLTFPSAISSVQTSSDSTGAHAAVREGNSTVHADSFAFPSDESPPIQAEKIDSVGEMFGQKIDKASTKASLEFGDWVK
jgi:hypothetical protein